MNSRVKVNRAKLIEALQRRGEQIKSDGVKERDRVTATMERQAHKAAAELRKIADDLERGKWPRKSYIDLPSRPSVSGADTRSLERAVAMLKLSDDPEITITAEDYGKYL